MKSSFFYPLCVIILVMVGIGCREDTILSGDMVSVDDTINTVTLPDTVTLETRTYFYDSLITSAVYDDIPVYHAVGNLTEDPYAGKTEAGMYVQIVPPSLNYSFPVYPDSAVLILPYGGLTYGDTASPVSQTIQVFQLDDTMSRSTRYYNNTEKQVNRSTVFGQVTLNGTEKLGDSVQVDGGQPPHLRIKLNDQFIRTIYDRAASGQSFGSYGEFIDWFKGFYIGVSGTAQGNLLRYFRLTGTTTYSTFGVLFYYTQDTVRTASFAFNPAYCAHYNKILRTYDPGSLTYDLINSNRPSDSIVVIQNQPGAALDVRIPHVSHLPKLPIINAELIVTQVVFNGDRSAQYWGPERLYPVGVNEDGSIYTLLDRFPVSSVEPLEFMDGKKKQTIIDNITVSQYKINIPRELQKAIREGRNMLHLRISGAATYPAAFRLIAGGTRTSASSTKIQLKIVYSKLN